MSRAFIYGLLFSVLANLSLHGQNPRLIDSLQRLADISQNDSVKVKLLNDIAWEYIFTDKNKAIRFARGAFDVARRSGNLNSLSDCYNTLGVYYYMCTHYDSALIYHTKAIEARSRIKDKRGLMKSYNNLGSVKKELGLYSEEAQYYFKSLELAEELKDSLTLVSVLNNIGNAFYMQKQYKQSLDYNRRALDIRRKINDWKGQIYSYIQIARVEHDLGNFKKARSNYQAAAALSDKHGDNYLEAKIHGNLGALYKDLGQYTEAIREIERSIPLNDKIGNQNSNLVNYLNLASTYEKVDRVPEALAWYEKAQVLARQYKTVNWEKQAYLGIAVTSYMQRRYKKAYENFVSYSNIKDSLQTEDFKTLLAETEAKYELKRKETEISKLRQKEQLDALRLSEQQLSLQTRNILLTGSVLLIVALLTAGYFYFSYHRLKAKRQKELAIRETEEKERLRIAIDLHDDLGSGLSKIRFLSGMAVNEALTDEKVSKSLRSIADTTEGLVENMRELIWALNPENTNLRNLVARVREYSADYLADFPLELSIEAPPVTADSRISKEVHRNVFFIVKECLQNIVKHAGATKVQICIRLLPGMLCISIRDNGRGIQPRTPDTGNGLRNIRQRAEMIGGRVAFNSQPLNGMEIVLELDLKSAWV